MSLFSFGRLASMPLQHRHKSLFKFLSAYASALDKKILVKHDRRSGRQPVGAISLGLIFVPCFDDCFHLQRKGLFQPGKKTSKALSSFPLGMVEKNPQSQHNSTSHSCHDFPNKRSIRPFFWGSGNPR